MIESKTLQPTRSIECRNADISAYVDGELYPEEEARLEIHVTGCAPCREELNLQKRLLAALDGPENDAEVVLPPDFARTVAVRAESSVSGLRRRGEFVAAGFISAGLLVFAAAALNGDASPLALAAKLLEKSSAAVGFASHALVDLARGTGFVIRTLVAQYVSGPTATVIAAFTVAFAILAACSRRLVRASRSGIR